MNNKNVKFINLTSYTINITNITSVEIKREEIAIENLKEQEILENVFYILPLEIFIDLKENGCTRTDIITPQITPYTIIHENKIEVDTFLSLKKDCYYISCSRDYSYSNCKGSNILNFCRIDPKSFENKRKEFEKYKENIKELGLRTLKKYICEFFASERNIGKKIRKDVVEELIQEWEEIERGETQELKNIISQLKNIIKNLSDELKLDNEIKEAYRIKGNEKYKRGLEKEYKEIINILVWEDNRILEIAKRLNGEGIKPHDNTSDLYKFTINYIERIEKRVKVLSNRYDEYIAEIYYLCNRAIEDIENFNNLYSNYISYWILRYQNQGNYFGSDAYNTWA